MPNSSKWSSTEFPRTWSSKWSSALSGNTFLGSYSMRTAQSLLSKRLRSLRECKSWSKQGSLSSKWKLLLRDSRSWANGIFKPKSTLSSPPESSPICASGSIWWMKKISLQKLTSFCLKFMRRRPRLRRRDGNSIATSTAANLIPGQTSSFMTPYFWTQSESVMGSTWLTTRSSKRLSNRKVLASSAALFQILSSDTC